MIWVNVAYGVGVIYGSLQRDRVLASDRQALHARHWRCLLFCVGNMSLRRGDRAVEPGPRPVRRGVWQDDGDGRRPRHALQAVRPRALVAIGFYGVFAYSTRHWTPLINAYLDVYLSWRWMYWAYVPVGLIAAVLVWCFFRPDRPPKPVRVPIDWLAVTTFVAWLVAIEFAFSWYRKWGGWSSNEFVVTVGLCVALPVVLVVWLGSGLSPDEHLKRLLRIARLRSRPDDPRPDAPAHGGRADDRRHVLHRAARLPADHGGLADGADLGGDGDDDLPHDLVSPPVAASCLVDRGDGRHVGIACGGCRRSIISRAKEHLAGHAGLLGSVPRADPPGVPHRRGRGAGPEGHALRRRFGPGRIGRAD